MVGENAGPIPEVGGRLHNIVRSGVTTDGETESSVAKRKARQLRPGRRARRHREQRIMDGAIVLRFHHVWIWLV